MNGPFVRALVMLAGVGAAHVATAQSTPCTLVPNPRTSLYADSTAAAGKVFFLGGGVLFKCPGRGITLRGDSAEEYADHDQMIGHAVYDEPRLHVTSNFLNYFPATEIVRAIGDVHATLPSGSTLVGPIAEWRRVAKGIRPRQQLLATSRPTINIVEKDSSGKSTPMSVMANQVFMDGDSLIYAGGQVIITRPEIGATSDSAFIDQTRETMRLMRNPVLKGKKEKPFTLSGDLIDLFSQNRKLQRVIARANALAVTDSMTLKADTIDLRVRDDVLDHAYAWGSKDRARVVSAAQNVLADSLDVIMPGQKIRLVRAVRNAFAQGKLDTTRFHIDGADSTNWLRGDTIVAHFDSLGPKDTSKTPPIKLLVASGHSSALYHAAASDTAEKRPVINYINARTILIDFDNKQQVSTVTAVDSIHAMYLDPQPDTAAKRAKSTRPPGKPAPGAGKPPAKSPAKPPAKPSPLPPGTPRRSERS
jgi:hypothetical protein